MTISKSLNYKGHRDRIKNRFLSDGSRAMQDFELLEILLFSAIPRRDVEPLAKSLINNFGGLSAVMAADPIDLAAVPSMTQDGAIAIKAAAALNSRAARKHLEKRDVFTNWDKLIDYCYASLAHEKREHFRVLFLTRQNELLADELQGSGSIDHTPAYPREVIRRALELGAAAIIMVHNHPSGDPRPSNADIALTKDVLAAAKPFKINVHDHIIIARQGYVSMKDAGLIGGDEK